MLNISTTNNKKKKDIFGIRMVFLSVCELKRGKKNEVRREEKEEGRDTAYKGVSQAQHKNRFAFILFLFLSLV
jgi:hypothetical protein